jgi:hypothetical protein
LVVVVVALFTKYTIFTILKFNTFIISNFTTFNKFKFKIQREQRHHLAQRALVVSTELGGAWPVEEASVKLG